MITEDYTSALQAYRQWFDLWLVTGLPRHRETAATCLRIARERCTAKAVSLEVQAARVRWLARSGAIPATDADRERVEG